MKLAVEFLPDIVGAIVGRELLKDDVGLIVGALAGEVFRRYAWEDILKSLGWKK